jgi:hypothetical protein
MLLVTLAPLLLLQATPAPATPPPPTTIAGAWTLVSDVRDTNGSDDQGGQGRGQSGRGGGGGYGRGGGGRHGGFGGGFGGGGFGGGGRGGAGAGGQNIDPEQAQRLRDALRDEMTAPSTLTITASGPMVVITAGDGRTTRLSADGKKIKDDSTKIERKTHWDSDKLVSEISGLGRGKITETYRLDPEKKQLLVTIHIDNQSRPVTLNRVYDPQAPQAQ